MEENRNTEEKMIPYFVHEGEMARQERHIKRLWVLCIAVFVAFVISNAGWIWYESQFEDVVTTVTQDTPNGNNNYIGRDGDIINGAADNNDKETETENGRQ